MTQPPVQLILVQTTSSDVAILKKIGRQMILERLAACVQVSGPIESQFYWEGKIDTAEEWLCSIKTTREAWPKIQQTILEMHNYDTPEIVALPILEASEAYAHWVQENIGMDDG